MLQAKFDLWVNFDLTKVDSQFTLICLLALVDKGNQESTQVEKF